MRNAKQSWDLKEGEKADHIEALKNAGNDFFKSAAYAKAIRRLVNIAHILLVEFAVFIAKQLHLMMMRMMRITCANIHVNVNMSVVDMRRR